MRDSDRGGGRRLVVWVCATAIFAASVGGIAAFESAIFKPVYFKDFSSWALKEGEK